MHPTPSDEPRPRKPERKPLRSLRPPARSLAAAGAWLLATGAAVTLSWWGVHTVMAGTAYDPPRALPVSTDTGDGDAHGNGDGHTDDSHDGPASPIASSTHRPAPSSPAHPSDGTGPSHTASTSPPPTRPPSGAAASGTSSGTVKSYPTRGGRVVFDIGGTSAKLVSATPASGWSVQVWKQPTWIRVEFASGQERVSVFCTWHDHKPTVQIDQY
ncbi:hypothetical protein [Streptomyces beihaiensis]|uniref:Secreted protein n=1 Tax=Streptomyces beihaiensis TaxID=2984495 RepID=A0ABT3TS76_9ACTN|nr:hypothetical protein [Streptomyces beihaiensis]MCX3058858.1 hypothetical protein [Streptomyces beihaiensis]